MEHIFVYATLKRRRIQEEVIHRDPFEERTALPGYTKARVEIGGTAYEYLVPDEHQSLKGELLEVTAKEKDLIDKWESGHYEPRKVRLMGGKMAWAYFLK